MEAPLLFCQIPSALPVPPLLQLQSPEEDKTCRDKALSVTSDGSWTHWPSTKNLYWCSPSGRSRIATKSLWLCRENRCATALLLMLWMLLFHGVPENRTFSRASQPFYPNIFMQG